MTASWAGLADALQSAPDLSGAACVGRWDLFDPPDSDGHESRADTRYRHDKAAAICRTCPILARCEEWATTLIPGEVSGVIAAVIFKPPTKTVTLPGRGRRAS